MTGVVPCPNPVCGHPSRLSLDPPGRVFRCRRCQTKLRAGAFVPPLAALTSTSGDPGLTLTFEDDLGEWLDGPLDGSSLPDRVDFPSSVPDWEPPSGTSGEVRLGRYRLLDPIGEGQYARVYRGYDPVLDRAVALKVPRPGALPMGTVQERFLGEARALARLRHPAIVPVFEMGRYADRWFIAMGLVEGPSLAELRERSGRHRLPADRGDHRRPGRRAGSRPRPGHPASRRQAGEYPHRRVGERLPDGLRPRLPARFGGGRPVSRGSDRHSGLHGAGTCGVASSPVPAGRRPVQPGRRLVPATLRPHPVLRDPHARPLPGDKPGTAIAAIDRACRPEPIGRHLHEGDGEAAGRPLPELCRPRSSPEALVRGGAAVTVCRYGPRREGLSSVGIADPPGPIPPSRIQDHLPKDARIPAKPASPNGGLWR